MKKLCVYFIFLIFGNASAMTDDEALIKMGKYLLTCAKEKNVDIADLMKLQNLEVPTKPEVKCTLACSYKQFGTLKSDGMFDLEAGYKFAEDMKEGDEKRLENGKKLADICIKVNDEKVSDGEKGCERSVLMYKCLIDHAPKLGFKVRLDPSKIGEIMKMDQIQNLKDRQTTYMWKRFGSLFLVETKEWKLLMWNGLSATMFPATAKMKKLN